jgi:hypothetical protein
MAEVFNKPTVERTRCRTDALLKKVEQAYRSGSEVDGSLIEAWESEYEALFVLITGWQLVGRVVLWSHKGAVPLQHRPLLGPIRALSCLRSHLVTVREGLNHLNAERLLRKAKKELSCGRVDEALDLLERVLRCSSAHEPARVLLKQIEGDEGC